MNIVNSRFGRIRTKILKQVKNKVMQDNEITLILKKRALAFDQLCKKLDIKTKKDKKKLRNRLKKMVEDGLIVKSGDRYFLPTKKSKKNKEELFKYLIGASLMFIFLVLIKTPYLNGPTEWAFPYFPQNIEYAIIPILLYSVFLPIVLSFAKKNNKIAVIAISCIFFFLFQTTYTLLSPRGINSIPQRINDPVTTGYYTISKNVTSYSEFMKNFENYMVGHHSVTHPPGSISFFYLANKTFLALPNSIKENVVNLFSPIYFAPYYHIYSYYFPQLSPNSFDQEYLLIVLSILVPLLSSLIIPATYFAAKNIFSEKTAIYSAIFAALIPSFLIFAPIMDQIFAIFPILSVGFLYRKGKKWLNYLLSGVIFSIGLFFTFGILVLVPMFIALIVFFEYKERRKINRRMLNSSIKYVAIFILGLISFQLLLYLIFNYNPISTFIHTKEGHNINKIRTYWLWLVFDLIIFFIMVGVPITVSFFHFIKTKIRNNKIEPFSFFTLITILLLDISGIIRGEVERIWMFFMPFFLIVGVYNITKSRWKYKWIVSLSLQFLCSLTMKAVMRVYP